MTGIKIFGLQAVPLMEDLAEFKSLEDEGRRTAFSKFVKRQKVCCVTDVFARLI